MGFTLIELMMVAVVVAVIAAIALPSYQSYVIKARRSDAKEALVRLALDQERFRANCPSYALPANLTVDPPVDAAADGLDAGDCAAGGLGYDTTDSQEHLYTLSITTADVVSFSLEAVPKAGGKQERDKDCMEFTLNKDGTRGSSPKGADICWR